MAGSSRVKISWCRILKTPTGENDQLMQKSQPRTCHSSRMPASGSRRVHSIKAAQVTPAMSRGKLSPDSSNLMLEVLRTTPTRRCTVTDSIKKETIKFWTTTASSCSRTIIRRSTRCSRVTQPRSGQRAILKARRATSKRRTRLANRQSQASSRRFKVTLNRLIMKFLGPSQRPPSTRVSSRRALTRQSRAK